MPESYKFNSAPATGVNDNERPKSSDFREMFEAAPREVRADLEELLGCSIEEASKEKCREAVIALHGRYDEEAQKVMSVQVVDWLEFNSRRGRYEILNELFHKVQTESFVAANDNVPMKIAA